MLRRYVISLLIVTLILSAVAGMFAFATRSQVRGGTTVEETWTGDFTLRISSDRFYRVDAEIQEGLEKGITFVGEGAVRVLSSKVEVTPKEVSWTSNKTSYTATGGMLVAHVRWEAQGDAADGAKGSIHPEIPQLPRRSQYQFDFRSGSYQRTGNRWVFREVTVRQGAVSLALGRLVFGGCLGLPVAFILHSGWWLLLMRRKKRAWLAVQKAQESEALPRTFLPDPTTEWTAWCPIVLIFGAVGTLMAGLAISSGYVSTIISWVILGIVGFGALVGLCVVWFVRRAVVSVKMDADSLSLAAGRGEPKWVTAAWGDLKDAVCKERTYKGNRTEWVEVIFPDGKKWKLYDTYLPDYLVIRAAVLSLYEQHHQPPGTAGGTDVPHPA